MTDKPDSQNSLKAIKQAIRSSLAGAQAFGQAQPAWRSPTLAVEFSGRRMKAVKVVPHRGRPTPGIVPLPDYILPEEALESPAKRTAAFGRQLRRLIRRHGVRQYCCVFNENDIRTLTVSLPAALPANDRANALAMKCLPLLGDDLDRWHVNATSLDPPQRRDKAQERRYIIAAVENRVLADYTAIFTATGVLPSFAAMPAELFQHLLTSGLNPSQQTDSVSGAEGVSLVADISNGVTSVYFFQDGIFEYSRKIQFGGDTLTDALTATVATPAGFVELGFEEAEALKKNVGIPQGGEDEDLHYDTLLNGAQIRMMLDPKLKDFVFELRNSIRYYQQQSGVYRIERLILTGGTALLKGLPDYVETHLKIKPQLFGRADLNFSLDKLEAQDAMALFSTRSKLCAILQQQKCGFNLLPAGFHWERVLRKPCRILSAASIMAAATLLAMSISIDSSLTDTQNSEDVMAQKENHDQNIQALKDDIQGYQEKTQALLAEKGGSIPIEECLADLARKTGDNMTLSNISISNTAKKHAVNVTGTISTAQQPGKLPYTLLVNAYESSPYIQQMQIQSLENVPGKESLFRFQLSIEPNLIKPLDNL